MGKPKQQPVINAKQAPAGVRYRSAQELITDAQAIVGDRYCVNSLAGRGGSGSVFAAQDSTSNQPVAIKLLSPDHDALQSTCERLRDRLTTEARAMAKLEHPALCKIVEVVLDTRSPFLVMAWADGEPLSQYASRLTTKTRITLILRIIDAVAAMHESGLIHGDLKPANILVDQSGNPTIVDFGLARADSDPSSIDPPRGGSPGYAAPEQLSPAGTMPIGPESDVFALGVLLYELLTERPPLPRSVAPAVFVDLLNRGAIRLPDEIAPNTPADLQKICLAAIEPDPARRYSDAGALAADIRRYLRREAVAARPTLLTDRLTDEVESQIVRTSEWHRLGMITKRDAENAARVLRALPHAESPWIIDARRLRGSQVALVTGGWLLILAITIGLRSADLGPAFAATLAFLASATILGLGVKLLRSGQKRLGMGMLITAQFGIPASCWLLLHLKYAPDFMMWPITAGQIAASCTAIISAISATLAIGLRTLTGRRFFSWALLVALLVFAMSSTAYIIDPVSLFALASTAFVIAAGSTLLGYTLDSRDHSSIDAPPLLSFGLVSSGIALAGFAMTHPGLYIGQPSLEPTAALIALASLTNAAILSAMLIFTVRCDTPFNRHIKSVARWVLPTHLMLPLVYMDLYQTFGVRTPWLIALLIASCGFIAASALHQWRPFLISGLVFLAVWFVRTTSVLSATPNTVLAISAVGTGLLLMLAAWRAPGYIAKRRLQRWTRAAEARPDPESSRTWR